MVEQLVELNDGQTDWIPLKLKDTKASNPIETAEYAVANQIAEEPAFKWWVNLHSERAIAIGIGSYPK